MRIDPVAVTVVLVCVLGAGTAVGRTQTAVAPDRGNRLAYEHSIRCFIANIYMVSEAQERGDQLASQRFERQGQRAFDAASRLGPMIGKTNAQMTGDLDAAEARELPNLVRDPAYRERVNSVCQRLGFM